MKSKLVAVMMCFAMLSAGCLANSPATDTVQQEIAAQHHAAVAMLQTYCGVIEASDSEMKKICESIAPVALQSEAAVQVALGLIFNLLTKRETLRQVTRDFASPECRK